ncbi:unnamed protein product, partial [Trichogramma brassicae]
MNITRYLNLWNLYVDNFENWWRISFAQKTAIRESIRKTRIFEGNTIYVRISRLTWPTVDATHRYYTPRIRARLGGGERRISMRGVGASAARLAMHY